MPISCFKRQQLVEMNMCRTECMFLWHTGRQYSIHDSCWIKKTARNRLQRLRSTKNGPQLCYALGNPYESVLWSSHNTRKEKQTLSFILFAWLLWLLYCHLSIYICLLFDDLFCSPCQVLALLQGPFSSCETSLLSDGGKSFRRFLLALIGLKVRERNPCSSTKFERQ